jgi:hypothetical protein
MFVYLTGPAAGYESEFNPNSEADALMYCAGINAKRIPAPVGESSSHFIFPAKA